MNHRERKHHSKNDGISAHCFSPGSVSRCSASQARPVSVTGLERRQRRSATHSNCAKPEAAGQARPATSGSCCLPRITPANSNRSRHKGAQTTGRLELIKALQSRPAQLCNTIPPRADIVSWIGQVGKVPNSCTAANSIRGIELFKAPINDYLLCSYTRLDELSNVQMDVAYLFERRQVAGAVPNAFLKAREKAASEL
jgi:hypothetical protein